MFATRACIAYAFVLVGVAISSTAFGAATVNYQGRMYHNAQFSGFGVGPVGNGFIVAGTFAPGFVVSDYFDIYGDEFGNVAPGHYSAAVAAGSFRPIGNGVLTSFDGSFSGSGTTNEPAGTPIYLFGFPTANPDSGLAAGVLASGSGSSFLVPANMGSTSIFAQQANLFQYGTHTVDGFAFGLLPIPEPSTAALVSMSALALLCRSRRRGV